MRKIWPDSDSALSTAASFSLGEIMDRKDRHASDDNAVTTYCIDPRLRDPWAILAGLTASGYEAIAAVASGRLWEGEQIDINPDRREHALAMASIWRRVATSFQVRAGEP